jgi:hypothetical protein
MWKRTQTTDNCLGESFTPTKTEEIQWSKVSNWSDINNFDVLMLWRVDVLVC